MINVKSPIDYVYGVPTRDRIRSLNKLYCDLCPFSALKTPCRQEESGKLVADNTEPDSDDSEAPCIAEQVGKDRADKCDADRRGDRCKQNVAGTSQASHIYHLGDL